MSDLVRSNAFHGSQDTTLVIWEILHFVSYFPLSLNLRVIKTTAEHVLRVCLSLNKKLIQIRKCNLHDTQCILSLSCVQIVPAGSQALWLVRNFVNI